MWISAIVEVDLGQLRSLKSTIDAQLEHGAYFDQVFQLWAYRYRSYTQLRFDTFSKGGGDWQKLAASTIAKRRKGKQPKQPEKKKSNLQASRDDQKAKKETKKPKQAASVSILRDTGTLFAALSPTFVGSPGAIQERIRYGIRVGYGGPQKHIGFDGKASLATVADIAAFHQKGNPPHLPKREIIVDPPESLIAQMIKDMQEALDKLIAQ